MKKRIVIAAHVDPSLTERLQSDDRFDLLVRPAKNEDDLTDAATDAEVLVTRTYNRVTRRVLDRATRLRAIAQGTSGIDNIDLDAARERRVTVIHLPGINANAVAELVIGFIIALTRTVPSYSRHMAGGVWHRDDCASRHELAFHRLGIIGLGQVGGRLARLARAFEMRVQAYDPYIADNDFDARGAARCPSLDELLRASDIVSLHVPLTAETRRMIGERELAAMPRGSFLINTARGEVLDLDRALSALGENHLGGLALDVFEPEPPTVSFPDDPRIILTPHIAGCTHECRSAGTETLYERIVRFCWGERV